MTRKSVYLAGGFRSKWQDKARLALTNFDILDPSGHDIQDPKAYTQWDLEAIRQCDVVLANMENTNPGGYSLALEIGYAKALGKQIVFVDQISNQAVKEYFEMVRQASDIVFKSLEEALIYLNKDVWENA